MRHRPMARSRLPLVGAAICLVSLAAAPFGPGERVWGADGPVGIRWEPDLASGLERARREGRPVLFCINALDNESANNLLANDLYRSRAWGDATAGYVCFACSPHDHMRADGTNARFPGTPSATCRAAFEYVVARYVEEPISPQHVVVEPDGTLHWRRPFFDGVSGPHPHDFEDTLSAIAPSIAYRQAAGLRQERIRAVLALPAAERLDAVRAWLATNDGLAAAGVLGVLDALDDATERLAITAALRTARPSQAAVIAWGAADSLLAPDDDPPTTLAFLDALLTLDRPRGAAWAARAIARSGSEATRSALIETWSGPSPIGRAPLDRLTVDERAAAIEALVIAGDRRGLESPRAGGAWPARLARARGIDASANGDDGPRRFDLDPIVDPLALAARLERAPASDVLPQAASLMAILKRDGSATLRSRVAVALLRARATRDDSAVADALLEGFDDPLDEPDLRPTAIDALGEDPGGAPEAWRDAIRARLQSESGS